MLLNCGVGEDSWTTRRSNQSILKEISPEYSLEELMLKLQFIGGSDGKASVYNEGDLGSIPRSGRIPGEGNGNPLQYFGHLMQRTDSCKELILMLRKIEGRRRRG